MMRAMLLLILAASLSTSANAKWGLTLTPSNKEGKRVTSAEDVLWLKEVFDPFLQDQGMNNAFAIYEEKSVNGFLNFDSFDAMLAEGAQSIIAKIQSPFNSCPHFQSPFPLHFQFLFSPTLSMDLFELLDEDQDGLISPRELRVVDIDEYYGTFRYNDDNSIISGLERKNPHVFIPILFRFLDKNKDGAIDATEVMLFVNQHVHALFNGGTAFYNQAFHNATVTNYVSGMKSRDRMIPFLPMDKKAFIERLDQEYPIARVGEQLLSLALSVLYDYYVCFLEELELKNFKSIAALAATTPSLHKQVERAQKKRIQTAISNTFGPREEWASAALYKSIEDLTDAILTGFWRGEHENNDMEEKIPFFSMAMLSYFDKDNDGSFSSDELLDFRADVRTLKLLVYELGLYDGRFSVLDGDKDGILSQRDMDKFYDGVASNLISKFQGHAEYVRKLFPIEASELQMLEGYRVTRIQCDKFVNDAMLLAVFVRSAGIFKGVLW